MRTRLGLGRTVAAVERPRAPNSDEDWVNGTGLNLAAAYYSLRPAGLASRAATASLRTLVHVQLTGLSGTAASSRGTATPGALHTFPHPLHSTTGVPLTSAHPIPAVRPVSTPLGAPRHLSTRSALPVPTRLRELPKAVSPSLTPSPPPSPPLTPTPSTTIEIQRFCAQGSRTIDFLMFFFYVDFCV